jgi:hypothetical protein
VIYYAHAGDEAIARAVVEVFKGCISDVLVYKESDRRKGIGSEADRDRHRQAITAEQDQVGGWAKVLGKQALTATVLLVQSPRAPPSHPP